WNLEEGFSTRLCEDPRPRGDQHAQTRRTLGPSSRALRIETAIANTTTACRGSAGCIGRNAFATAFDDSARYHRPTDGKGGGHAVHRPAIALPSPAIVSVR